MATHGGSADEQWVHATACLMKIASWSMTEYPDGYAVLDVQYHGTKEMLTVAESQQLKQSMEHYTKMRARVEEIGKYLCDGDAHHCELLEIASEALSAVFLYMGMAHGELSKQAPQENEPNWSGDTAADMKLCRDWVSSHGRHSDFMAKNNQPIANKNYSHILNVAKKATEIADNLLKAADRPTAKELAEELSTDMEFLQEFRSCEEMRIQRAYDACHFVWLWAWWKEGEQNVGTTGRTWKEAKAIIYKEFGVTEEMLQEASDRLEIHV